MPHAAWAREGDVIFRFEERPARDAWVAEAPDQRRAIPAAEVPLRIKTGRSVPGLELRSGYTGGVNPVVIRRRRGS